MIIFTDAEKLFHSTFFFTKFNSHPRNTRELLQYDKEYVSSKTLQLTYILNGGKRKTFHLGWEQGRNAPSPVLGYMCTGRPM